jgi:hypothetical protein
MIERPAYKSETYYNVVFGIDTFHGWRNIFAGDGALIFRHKNGEEARFYGGHALGWLEKAWNQFTAMVATKEA